jgi:coatomer subunit epsilon
MLAALRAVKLLATVMKDPSDREIAMLQLQEWLEDPTASNNATLKFIAAILYMHDNNLKEAIKLITPPANMEQ